MNNDLVGMWVLQGWLLVWTFLWHGMPYLVAGGLILRAVRRARNPDSRTF